MSGLLKKTLGTAFIAVFSLWGQFSPLMAENKIKTFAVVYNIAGKSDNSFGASAYKGAMKFQKETGVKYIDFEIANESQREQAIKRMAKKADIVLTIAYAFITPLQNVAAKYPEKKFVIIDAVVDLPNVKSVVFREHEGCFLVGMLAAMKTESGKIGFVGGQKSPLISKFELGYVEGAKYINPNIDIFATVTGLTSSAWNDPARGAELAKSQIDRGADVIFAAAGSTGDGVYQAAADNGVFAIGVDSNQNHLQPGTMLTSMLKRVDVGVYKALVEANEGRFQGGVEVLGIKEGGIDYAVDQYNEKLLTNDMLKKVDQAKTDIVNGKIKVSNYLELNKKN